MRRRVAGVFCSGGRSIFFPRPLFHRSRAGTKVFLGPVIGNSVDSRCKHTTGSDAYVVPLRTMIEQFQTLAQPSQAEFRDRGSQFIAYAMPVQTVDQCKSHLQEIRKEHPKATHHCFAYRLGIDGNQFRANDDGEPSGTAGKPILGQIDSRELTDLQVVVVRYFGGTQLGVPGLIQAYKTATALSLQLSPVLRKSVLKSFSVEFDYTRTNEVMRLLRELDISILKQQHDLFSKLEVGVPVRKILRLQERLQEMPGILATPV